MLSQGYLNNKVKYTVFSALCGDKEISKSLTLMCLQNETRSLNLFLLEKAIFVLEIYAN